MAIIYSYPSSSPLLSDLMIISRTPSNPNETANYSISLEDLAGLLSGTGTVTSFSATSTIPGITTTVATASSTPSLTIGITGTPAAGTYLDNTGNFTTPAGGGGGGGTLQQVLQAGNTTGNNKIFAQGGASGGMNFADNTILTFGTGNDLSIKHSSVSGESEILETGTGGLTITGSSTITFKAGLLGDTYAIFNDNGAVSLRYDNVVKFETTTDGIKVADRIEASTTNANLQVQGNGTGYLEVRSANAATPGTIQLNCEQNSHGVSIQSPAHSAGATYTLKLPTTVGTNTQVLQTDGNNPAQLSWAANTGSGGVTGSGAAGQVTFWTGASTVSSDNTFLWDSTNNRLGIGTVAPSQAIDVTGAGKYYGLNGKAFASTTSTTADPMQIGDISGVGFPLQLLDNTGTSVLHVTSGNVGIGTTTPSEKLYVNGNLLVIGAFLDSNSTSGISGQVLSSTNTGTDWINNTSLSSSTTNNLLGINVSASTGPVAVGLDINNLAEGTLPNTDEIYIPYYDEANDVNRKVAYADLPSSGGGSGTVTSVAASIDGNSIAISGSPITSSGTLTFAFDGDSSEYINGAGELANTSTLPGDTYDLNAGTKVGISVPLNLTSGSGTDNSLVTLTEGSGVTLTRNSATEVIIASSGGGGGATDINGLSDAATGASGISLGKGTLLGLGNVALVPPNATNLALDSTAQYNILVGYDAGTRITGGDNNIVIGKDSLSYSQATLSTGEYNIILGTNAARRLHGNSSSNIAIGNRAMDNTAGGNTNQVSLNTVVGNSSGINIDDGADGNTLIGASSNGSSLSNNGSQTSKYCTTIGYDGGSYGAQTNGVIRIGCGDAVIDTTITNSGIGQVIIGNSSTGGAASTWGNVSPSIRPAADNLTDLGTDTYRYKDVYYDGVLQSGTLNSAPASATATGTTGEIRFTADYIYVCVATNTWKRTAISTW